MPPPPDNPHKNSGPGGRPTNLTCVGDDSIQDNARASVHCDALVGECSARGGALVTQEELELWGTLNAGRLWEQQRGVVAPAGTGVTATRGVSDGKA